MPPRASRAHSENHAACLAAARADGGCADEFGTLEDAQRSYEQTMAAIRRRCPEDQIAPGA